MKDEGTDIKENTILLGGLPLRFAKFIGFYKSINIVKARGVLTLYKVGCTRLPRDDFLTFLLLFLFCLCYGLFFSLLLFYYSIALFLSFCSTSLSLFFLFLKKGRRLPMRNDPKTLNFNRCRLPIRN